MDLPALVAQHGGSCSWQELRAQFPARAVRAAVASGSVTRAAQGRYELADQVDARSTALRLHGVASHTTAALHWGWGIKKEPEAHHLTFRRGRKLQGKADKVTRHWRHITDADVVDGWVTSQARTVVDCCLDLPLDEALSVADSALRLGVTIREIAVAATRLPKRLHRRVVDVVTLADRQAANPFESVLRAQCLGLQSGLKISVQHVIKDSGFYARVDLAIEELKIVIEAESLAHHADRDALRSDCDRYTGLAARGWVVLRFTWHQVMHDPAYVIEMVRRTIEARRTQLSGR